MKVVYNNIIPFKGYLAACVFPFVFVRKDARDLKTTDINHEKIHGKQQIELLWVLFFTWYCVEWLVRFVAYGLDGQLAYRNVCFEQEAYEKETDLSYPYERKHFFWLSFLFHKKYLRDKITGKIVKKQ